METLGILLLLLVFAALQFGPRWLKRKAYRPRSKIAKFSPPKDGKHNNWGLTDPEKQMSAIAKVAFEKRKLLNTSEFRVFRELEEIASSVEGGYRVMAQTSLGEVIAPKDNSGDWKSAMMHTHRLIPNALTSLCSIGSGF